MTDTRKRIKAYKAALPGLRERVTAVALLLAMSMAMMTSATFAWLTISRRPEVSGVSTTLAANGNLEIALVSPDGSEPGESKVGDSSAAEGQTIAKSNLTWGNLINLSDPSYGLDNLTLRPAQLNKSNLLEKPLSAAMYEDDGRITQLADSFAYTMWNPPVGNVPGSFLVSDKYGIRAVSSTRVEASGAAIIQDEMLGEATGAHSLAQSVYLGIVNNDTYMNAIATLMGYYMTYEVLSSDSTVNATTLSTLRSMYIAFDDAFNKELLAITNLANLRLWLQYGNDTAGNPNYTPYTVDTILNETTASLKNKDIPVQKFDQFKKDHQIIKTDLEFLQSLSGNVNWSNSGIADIVSHLMNTGSCTLDGTPISSIGVSNATKYLDGKTHEAIITNGVLYNFEERIGVGMEVKGLKVSVSFMSVKANITTSASGHLFGEDLAYVEQIEYDGEKSETATDTYGMAIDFWVRTNSESNYLTLGGNLLTKEHEEYVKGKDADGNEVDIYTIMVEGEEVEGITLSQSVDIYYIEVDGAKTWYEAETHTEVPADVMGDQEPKRKVEIITDILGYEGENRIWTEDNLLSVDATTQGSGSCYVYYADTPEDQARSLKLLEAMRVVFVDDNGDKLTYAYMDTANAYAENGRVTVPLVLDATDSVDLGTDFEGNKLYGITSLKKNEATRITALVYLDGTKLTNQDVLAASDIQGKLNIQFSSHIKLDPIENETLASKILRVTASADKTAFAYDTATEPMITRVTVRVEGSEPTNVTAFFLRQVSTTQGSREEEKIFTSNGDGTWYADFEFFTPGTYVLRSVQLDGQNYDLSGDSLPKVTVTGFTLESLNYVETTGNHYRHLSADSATSVGINLKFATDDVTKMPHKVQGRFLNDNTGAAVNVDFTMNATTQIWSGTAHFLTSGDYTMEYLLLDGEYMWLEENMQKTADITLGLRVAVYTTESTKPFFFIPSEMKANGTDLLDVEVIITDNAGNVMPGLSNVQLNYSPKGSSRDPMNANLTWNGESYAGELRAEEAGPGVWQFLNVTVGEGADRNILANATTYPVFTMISKDPPEYYGFNPHTSDVFAPNGGVTMNVQLKYSSTAAAKAWIENENGDGAWVTLNTADATHTNGSISQMGDDVNLHNWNFLIPTSVNGKNTQDGIWTLKTVHIFNAYDKDGNPYTEEEPMVIDMTPMNHTVKVVQSMFINFPAGKSQNFGLDAAGNVEGDFMETYSVSALNVDIMDMWGNPISSVSDVQLVFAYDNISSETNGGYTSTALNNQTDGATITVPLNTVNGTNYAQSEAVTFKFAGNYYTTFSFRAGGKTYTYTNNPNSGVSDAKLLPTNAPVFSVWSVKPTARISAVSPTSASNTKITWTTDWKGTPTFTASESKTNSRTDYVAELYGKATVDNSTRRHGDFAAPSLSITAAEVPDGWTVSMTLPAGTASSAVEFSRTGSGVITKTIGTVSQLRTFGLLGHYLQGYTGHGNVEITAMTLTKDGMSYTVTLDNKLVITNPSSVNKT